jgi:hypothetical protein
VSNEIQKSYSMGVITNASNSIVKRALRDIDRMLRNNSKTDCGTDSDRFISLANDYKAAVVLLDVAGSSVKIESDNSGQLKVSFDEINKDEPVTLITKLSGKSMTLDYDRGEFKEEWAKRPLTNAGDFKGELAEIILMLLIIHT